MKNIPTTIQLAGIDYKVETAARIQDDNGRELIGDVTYPERTIRLRDGDEAVMKKVLVHEMTHAILEEYGMSRFNKEDFVDRLSAALFDVLTRNDMQWLVKRPKTIIDTPKHVLSGDFLNTWMDRIADMPANLMTEEVISPVTQVEPQPAHEEKPKAEEPEFYKTGIKEGRKGELRYKTHVVCPDCGKKANAYVPETQHHWNCYTCNTKIAVRFATEGGFPERDQWGNYFVAYDYYDPTTAGDYTPEEFIAMSEGEDRKDE